MEHNPISLDWDDAQAVLSVAGDLDEDNLTAFGTSVASSSGDFSRSITVDLSGVTFLPSSALGLLLTSVRSAETNGATLELVARTGSIADTILKVGAIPHRSA